MIPAALPAPVYVDFATKNDVVLILVGSLQRGLFHDDDPFVCTQTNFGLASVLVLTLC